MARQILPRPPKAATRGDELATLFVHATLVIVGGFLLGHVLGALVFGFFSLATGGRFPVGEVVHDLFYWCSSVVLGFCVNRVTRHRAACWVGVVGIAGLCAVAFLDVSQMEHSLYYQRYPGGPWRYEFDQLFTRKCGGGECLEQLLVTAPALSSIAYSVGAWFGFRFPQSSNEDPKFSVDGEAPK